MPYPSPKESAGADEATLARRIGAAAPGRDRDAEGELYRCLAPRVRLYGLKHLRDAAAAADLAQDVLLMTLQRLRSGEIREPDRVASFVLGTSRQMVIDRRRGETRHQRILAAFAVDLSPPEVSGDRYALDSGRLRRCLELLPERERTIVLSSFYDERSAADVGSEVGLSAANVASFAIAASSGCAVALAGAGKTRRRCHESLHGTASRGAAYRILVR